MPRDSPRKPPESWRGGGSNGARSRPKHAQQAVGIARDIIREMDEQKYETAVIGKKGMGWFDEYFLGSITSKLLEISENHPLWVVEGKGFSRPPRFHRHG